MKRTDNKSRCSVNFALETVGDNWSLLIVRDIVYYRKKTFGEFLASEEGISTNILSSRLARLERKGVLTKRPHDTDKRKETYALTERGLDLVPVLLELADWGAKHDPEAKEGRWIGLIQDDRAGAVALVKDTVRAGGSVFVGEGNVIEQLNSRAKEPT
ncbi:transcriptional regulator, HxlR family [Paenibacillus sp. UNC496MF]|uniref:winged helix-turn-helix transcriptional regulator n=1 Tax=Paenibacillus sp. UNC496MF TaxID=1502753 RepID=UPI0008E58837|nr:helix-turn-helix domain-containing protein [Paenibacillus sp. UNC496MF]SFJ25259.1 transcriptional regulator, HxlR family [Paenibacillus sp. UNC496MF]